ncbi:MAG: carbohydrate binding family 9 domain-containing protein [Bacteroidetes bacterium]|nr:carbohydrate binding family 9 domain-containing protein [Bacteroidota bacterium]
MKNSILFYVLTGIVFITCNLLTAQNQTGATERYTDEYPKVLYPLKISSPPKIDGIIDEPMWNSALKIKDFKTYSPDFGRDLSALTECYMAYDVDNLYFAFNCAERGGIKSSIAGRDEITGDDFVCIKLDSFGDQQSLYSFYVNPHGIQADSRDTRSNQNFQFDALWDCESVLSSEGYTVEIKIPLKSIRFPQKDSLVMKILLQRNFVLQNECGTYPAMDPQKGLDWLTQTMPVVYESLNVNQLVEILPALTYSHKEMNDRGVMTQNENRGKISLTGKYGITQDLILDATYNPDFSQVEADAGQIDVNLRYQLYYPEARPFFLEGSENFTTAIGPRLIHTRNIVNPIYGAKLTGKITEGHSISALYVKDELQSAPGQYHERADFGILRYKADLGSSSYIGGLFTAKELSNYNNRVAAFDGYISTSEGSGVAFLSSYSHTSDKNNSIENKGHALQVKYNENTREKLFYAEFIKISSSFNPELGLPERTGMMSFSTTYGRIFYPRSEMLLTVKPVLELVLRKDDLSGLWEETVEFCLRNTFANRISSHFLVAYNSEVFLGNKFKRNYIHFGLESQVTSKLYFLFDSEIAQAIYYDNNPYQGLERYAYSELIFQPFSYINLSASVNYSDFYKETNGEKIFDYLILRLKASYQFSRHLYFRGVIQSNNYRKTLLTDFLLSYTYSPGTVLYLGYGSMYEKTEWRTDRYYQSENYLETNRGFFLKASYLWRL